MKILKLITGLLVIILITIKCNVIPETEYYKDKNRTEMVQVTLSNASITALPPKPTRIVENPLFLETLTPTYSLTSTQASKPTWTQVPTSSYESTPTPTDTPTWTQVPTLSLEKLRMNLLDLFSTNGGCDYPCWWGIQPGMSIENVLSLSSLLGESPTVRGGQYSFHLSLDEMNFGDLGLVFYEREKIVQQIEIDLVYPYRVIDYADSFEKNLSVNSILSQYGKPTTILLKIQPRAEQNAPIMYTLTLIYEARGFGVEYFGNVTAEEPIQICINLRDHHLQTISLYLQNPDAMGLLQNRLYNQDFRQIEEVTEMSLDDFYYAFSSNENVSYCIESQAELWK